MVRPGYKHTEIGVIPEDWGVERLGDIFKLSSGSTKPAKMLSEQGGKFQFPVYGGNGITGYSKVSNCKGKAIVIGRVGEYCGITRFVASPLWVTDNALYTKGFHIDVDRVFLTLLIQHFDLSSLRSKGGQPLISQVPINSLSLPLPPLKEQQAIAEVLTDVDDLISSLQKLIDKKRAIKTASMQQLLTGKTRLPGFGEDMGYKQTEIGVIPEDWGVERLEHAAQFLDEKRIPIKQVDRAKMRGGIPYYGASGIVDYVNDYIFDEELILLGEDGENILSRHTPLAFKVTGKFWVNNHAHVMRPTSRYSIDYLTAYLASLDYSILNSGTAQPKLNKQTCYRISILCPPLEEQQAIAKVLTDMDDEISALQKRLEKTRQLKQGMMQELLTGKTRLV